MRQIMFHGRYSKTSHDKFKNVLQEQNCQQAPGITSMRLIAFLGGTQQTFFQSDNKTVIILEKYTVRPA